MEVCFDGIGQTAATFPTNSDELEPGMAVALMEDGTVGLGKDGDLPCGVVLGSVRGDAAAVQISGAVKTVCSGTVPKAGWKMLACDGKGGVKTVSGSGLNCLVLSADEDEKTVVIKL